MMHCNNAFEQRNKQTNYIWMCRCWELTWAHYVNKFNDLERKKSTKTKQNERERKKNNNVHSEYALTERERERIVIREKDWKCLKTYFTIKIIIEYQINRCVQY